MYFDTELISENTFGEIISILDECISKPMNKNIKSLLYIFKSKYKQLVEELMERSLIIIGIPRTRISLLQNRLLINTNNVCFYFFVILSKKEELKLGSINFKK